MKLNLKDLKLTNDPFSLWASDVTDAVKQSKIVQSSDLIVRNSPVGSTMRLHPRFRNTPTFWNYVGEFDMTSDYDIGDVVRVLHNKTYSYPLLQVHNLFPGGMGALSNVLTGQVKIPPPKGGLGSVLILDVKPTPGVWVCVAPVPSFFTGPYYRAYGYIVPSGNQGSSTTYFANSDPDQFNPDIQQFAYNIRLADVDYSPHWPELSNLAVIDPLHLKKSLGRYWDLISSLPLETNSCKDGTATKVWVDSFTEESPTPAPAGGGVSPLIRVLGPDPPYNLTVSSGSAILNWHLYNIDADHTAVHKSSDGLSFSILTNVGRGVMTYTDAAVSVGNSYFYKLQNYDAFGSSSFSNVANIAFTGSAPPASSCIAPNFQAYILSSSISSPLTRSFVSNGTGSLALWARSADFDTIVDVYDPLGNFILSDDVSGYNPGSDIDNAALNIPLTMTGSYTIHLSAFSGFGGGNFNLFVYPGADLEFSYATASSDGPPAITYVSSSGVIVLSEDYGSHLLFYDPATKTVVNQYTSSFDMGQVAYSPVQDRVFQGRFQHLYEYDHTGSLITSYSLNAGSFLPELIYNPDRDHILLTSGLSDTGARMKYVVWDCATRTVLNQTSMSFSSSHGFGFGCYSNVSHSYYVTQFGSNLPLITIDANTYTASALNNILNGQTFVASYLSESKVVALGDMNFLDPLTNTITASDSSPTNVHNYNFYEAAAYAPCAGVGGVLIDSSGGTTGLFLYNNAFTCSNFLAVNTLAGVDGGTINSYGTCYDRKTSKTYMLLNDFIKSYLYSVNISIPTGSIIL